jgi:hypothetical protein
MWYHFFYANAQTVSFAMCKSSAACLFRRAGQSLFTVFTVDECFPRHFDCVANIGSSSFGK